MQLSMVSSYSSTISPSLPIGSEMGDVMGNTITTLFNKSVREVVDATFCEPDARVVTRTELNIKLKDSSVRLALINLRNALMKNGNLIIEQNANEKLEITLKTPLNISSLLKGSQATFLEKMEVFCSNLFVYKPEYKFDSLEKLDAYLYQTFLARIQKECKSTCAFPQGFDRELYSFGKSDSFAIGAEPLDVNHPERLKTLEQCSLKKLNSMTDDIEDRVENVELALDAMYDNIIAKNKAKFKKLPVEEMTDLLTNLVDNELTQLDGLLLPECRNAETMQEVTLRLLYDGVKEEGMEFHRGVYKQYTVASGKEDITVFSFRTMLVPTNEAFIKYALAGKNVEDLFEPKVIGITSVMKNDGSFTYEMDERINDLTVEKHVV